MMGMGRVRLFQTLLESLPMGMTAPDNEFRDKLVEIQHCLALDSSILQQDWACEENGTSLSEHQVLEWILVRCPRFFSSRGTAADSPLLHE